MQFVLEQEYLQHSCTSTASKRVGGVEPLCESWASPEIQSEHRTQFEY
jgi:hypothetical protein